MAETKGVFDSTTYLITRTLHGVHTFTELTRRWTQPPQPTVAFELSTANSSAKPTFGSFIQTPPNAEC